jgi:dTDP-4-dehydrorhamnose 3,5-epimerase
MRLIETPIGGAFLVEPERHGDERGFFSRMWDTAGLEARGLKGAFVQCNNSFSARKGTLRGLHYQAAPHPEAKLVRCVRGVVFDVVVDVRPDSPSYMKWFGARLTPDERTMMFVPEGCAHAFLTLEDVSEVIYTVTATYHPECERGIRWNDPLFAIDWPIKTGLTLSPKDEQWPDYRPLDQAQR